MNAKIETVTEMQADVDAHEEIRELTAAELQIIGGGTHVINNPVGSVNQ